MQSFQTPINREAEDLRLFSSRVFFSLSNLKPRGADLSDPIDVYTDWIDACEAVNQTDQGPGAGQGRRREEEGRRTDQDAEGEDDDDDDLPELRIEMGVRA
jgi:hypothetical protein